MGEILTVAFAQSQGLSPESGTAPQQFNTAANVMLDEHDHSSGHSKNPSPNHRTGDESEEDHIIHNTAMTLHRVVVAW